MATEFKLPDLGENIASGDVVTVFVSEGDVVKPGQALLEVDELLHLAFHQATNRNAGPSADDLGDVLVVDERFLEILVRLCRHLK